MKIGFFDSGIGGLMVLQAVRKKLPDYDYVFYGDTEHVPYGDKTEEEIYEFTKEGVTRLFNEGALLVIVACNTASAETLRKLQDTFVKVDHPDKKVLGVIIPTVETIEALHAKKPLLIATQRTVESQKFNVELHKIDPDIDLNAVAAPELVPLIENNMLDDAFVNICKTIDPLVGETDTIILGCTHYTILKEKLRDQYQIPIVSQDEIIPEKLELYLNNHPDIKSKLSNKGTVEIILSKESEHYNQLRKSMDIDV